MAELIPDLVTCPLCKQERDRNVVAQCPDDFTNLWALDRVVTPEPPPPPPEPGGVKTFMEPDPAGGSGSIDILVCGRRLTVEPGRTLQLGREDGLENADVFREAINISRLHAELRYDGRTLWVKDTKSTNGTYVNEQKLEADDEYELRPGQSLRFASNVPVEILWEK
jgi:hypothetical protein